MVSTKTLALQNLHIHLGILLFPGKFGINQGLHYRLIQKSTTRRLLNQVVGQALPRAQKLQASTTMHTAHKLPYCTDDTMFLKPVQSQLLTRLEKTAAITANLSMGDFSQALCGAPRITTVYHRQEQSRQNVVHNTIRMVQSLTAFLVLTTSSGTSPRAGPPI